MKISVITSSLARKELVLRLLKNLANQIRLPDEIVLVEAGGVQWSKYDFPLILRDRIAVIYALGESVAASKNRGRLSSKGDVLIFLDDDVIISDHYISDAIDYLDANNDVMGVGGIYTDSNIANRSKFTVMLGRIFGVYADGTMNRILSGGWADYVRLPYSKQITPAEWLFGCNYAIRSKSFVDLRVCYPVQMAAWSFLEDVFLGSRLTSAYGICLRVLPSLTVVHDPIISSGCLTKATLRMRILYRYIFWRDYVSDIRRKSKFFFVIGLFANLLLMLKQEKRLWVISQSAYTYHFLYRNKKMNWDSANEFIFA